MIIKSKNRIAFTLAEMMIVVLIVSVLSAAVLPSITTRRANDDSNVQGATIWSKGVNGLYYVGNATRKLFIGADAKTFGSNKKLEYQDEIGDTTLMIYEETPYSDSRLFFYDSYLKVKNGVGGGTRFDEGKNIGIGREMFYGVTSTYSTSNIAIGDKPAQLAALNTGHHYFKNSIMIGTATGNLPETDSYANNAIFIGYSAARFNNLLPIYANNTIAIGTYAMYASRAHTDQNDISIGAYANASGEGSNEYFTSYGNNISIGAYASHAPKNRIGVRLYSLGNGINIGAYTKPIKYIDDINIGYYAEYNGTFGSATTNGDGYSVNIGAYANSNMEENRTVGISSLKKSVNIGHRAAIGKRNVTYSTIMGAYAGGLFDSTISTGTNIEYSVAIGNYAIANSTSAYGITAIGSNAGQNSKNQRLSMFVGYFAGYGATYANNSSASYAGNVYLGSYAGTSANGYGNVYIGYETGKSETGNHNLYIGSGCQGMSYSNATCLFANPKGEKFKDRVSITGYSSGKSYMFIMPRITGSNWSNTWITLFGKVYGPSTTMTAFSDKRLKENIVPTKYGIDKLRKVNVYNFNMKNDPKTPHIGVIAQEIKNIYPQAVIVNPSTGFYNVQNDWILYSLLQSIKDVDNSISKLSIELKTCIKNIAKLAQKVTNLEQRLNSLAKSNNDLNKKLLYLENNSKKMEHK